MINSSETLTLDYAWRGIDQLGKHHEGVISAKSLLLAKVSLRGQGYTLAHIALKTKPLLNIKRKQISKIEITIFIRQLSTLFNAGIPLVQAITIISHGHDNASMRTLLSSIKDDLEKGETFAETLKKSPQYFDTLFCNLIEVGEHAGVLETLLDKIASYQEKSDLLKKKALKALTYPLAVMTTALIVTSILLIFVVPIFKDMFKSFGAELPVFTQWIVDLSEIIINDGWILLLLILISAYAFNYFKKHSEAFNYFIDKSLLKLPIINPLINKAFIARFARTLATLSAAGVPIVDALQLVAGTCGNRVYYNALLAIREDVATGQQLQYALQKTHLFPHLVQQMIAIGEESGELDYMLSKIAEFYEAEVDNFTDNLSALMEPIIMIILGLLIGGLVVAMYLPIFKMGSAIN